MATHTYTLDVAWTGDRGEGTSGFRTYGRDVLSRSAGRPDLLLSADKPFRGDPARWNPEVLLLAALSECHLLSYLHACVEAGVVVVAYEDDAAGLMRRAAMGAMEGVAGSAAPCGHAGSSAHACQA